MEKPKNYWLLYLDKVEELKEYHYCEGRELSRSKTHATLEITRTFGSRKDLPDNRIVDMPLEHLRLGCEHGEHSEYLKYCIKEVNTKYLKDNKYWYLNSIFGYDQILEVINENDGILDDSTVEEIARRSKVIYKVLETRTGAMLVLNENPWHSSMNKAKILEEITSLEALQSYGVVCMEEVHEKTCAWVDKSIILQKLRDKKIKDILND